MGDPGLWFGLVGAIVAITGVAFQWMDRARTARQDQVSYLSQRVADLERANELCEMRCEELREEMLDLMGQLALTPKRRRKAIQAR